MKMISCLYGLSFVRSTGRRAFDGFHGVRTRVLLPQTAYFRLIASRANPEFSFLFGPSKDSKKGWFRAGAPVLRATKAYNSQIMESAAAREKKKTPMMTELLI